MDVTMPRAAGRTTVMVSARAGARVVRVGVAAISDLQTREARFVDLTLAEVDWLMEALEDAKKDAARKAHTHYLRSPGDSLQNQRTQAWPARRRT